MRTVRRFERGRAKGTRCYPEHVRVLRYVMGVACLAACGGHGDAAVFDATPRPRTPDANGDSLVCSPDANVKGVFGGPCTVSTDCGGTAYCVFKESDGCSATGQCFMDCGAVAKCAHEVYGCACDGSESVPVPCALFPGYALQPLRSTPGPASSCVTDAAAASDGGAG